MLISRFIHTGCLGLCLFSGPARAVYADLIYSDLGGGQNGSYSVGGGSWYAVPWIGSQGPGGSDFAIPALSNSVFLDEIDVTTAPLGDNVMTVDIVNGSYAFASGTIRRLGIRNSEQRIDQRHIPDSNRT